MAIHHGLLTGMKLLPRGFAAGQGIGSPDRHAMDRVRQTDATINRLVAQPVILYLSHYNSACTTITLATAFFHSAAVQVFAQDLQERARRRHIFEADDLIPMNKLQGGGFHA